MFCFVPVLFCPIPADIYEPCHFRKSISFRTQNSRTDESNMASKMTFEDILSAAEKIKGNVKLTPCERSHCSDALGMEIYLKKEFMQHTGSFKERGALNAMLNLSEADRAKGVIAVSMGNHAQAMSYHGRNLGIPTTVVMPQTSPLVKVQKCRAFKANVLVEGKDFTEATQIAAKLTEEKGYTYVSPYNNVHVMAGQGTIGLEILEQVPDIEAVVVPVGGGGLISGIAVAVKHLKPHIKIIAVEPERAASYTNARAQGKATLTQTLPTVADGLAVAETGSLCFEASNDLIDKMVQVKEELLCLAILKYLENDKCVVEGAGAATLAAALGGYLDEFKGKKIVLIVSGGNIDTTILGRCIDRGLASETRLIKCRVPISDKVGGLKEMCQLFENVGVSIKHVSQVRAWVQSDVFTVEAVVIGETRDDAQAVELYNQLKSAYKKCRFDSFPCDFQQ